jgi:hypothetical protein
MRAPVARLGITGPAERLAALRAGMADLVAAGVVGEVSLEEGPPGEQVTLGDQAQAS